VNDVKALNRREAEIERAPPPDVANPRHPIEAARPTEITLRLEK
jgi:hypothetical protein